MRNLPFDSNKLLCTMQAFAATTNLPIDLLDESGNVLLHKGPQCEFCQYFNLNTQGSSYCAKIHLGATKQSELLGESYTFICPAGLTHIAMALAAERTFQGGFIIGPFLMDDATDLLVEELYQHFILPETLSTDLHRALQKVPLITPTFARYYAQLLECIASTIMLKNAYMLAENQKNFYIQREINESIQEQKTHLDAPTYPYYKEKTLFLAVRSGDIEHASASLNELLGHILFNSGNSLDIIKVRAIELCSLLSREVMELTQDIDFALTLNSNFILQVNTVESVEALCYLLDKIIHHYTRAILKSQNISQLPIIKRALNYINIHYASPLSLLDVAQYVHLNPSYFSSLFKKETGQSFSQYLNQLRIEHSKLILKNTNLSIIHTALEVGFETDTYFCTTFKKLVGSSPKQYRKQLLSS